MQKKIVFEWLGAADLKIKKKKCDYLGHINLREGMKSLHSNLKAFKPCQSQRLQRKFDRYWVSNYFSLLSSGLTLDTTDQQKNISIYMDQWL